MALWTRRLVGSWLLGWGGGGWAAGMSLEQGPAGDPEAAQGAARVVIERLCQDLNLDAASAAAALRDFTALQGTYSLEVRAGPSSGAAPPGWCQAWAGPESACGGAVAPADVRVPLLQG